MACWEPKGEGHQITPVLLKAQPAAETINLSEPANEKRRWFEPLCQMLAFGISLIPKKQIALRNFKHYQH